MADAKRRLQITVMATAGTTPAPAAPGFSGLLLPLEGAIYAGTIPFTETRDYVKKS